ncbi:ABC transporter permease [Alphaproteobacteria bacterium]|nr:ABC transporter permease [Alphaproteobacteria bacterium]
MLLMILGMTIITVSILVNQITKDTFNKNNPNLDVVVGAKGSPLQLVLSSIHHIDIPTGNISYKNAKKIIKHPAIKFGVPISLGDNFQNFRIVGTDKKLFKLYNAEIKIGSIWEKPMQAVIGYNVATLTKLKIEKFFVGSHGLIDTGDIHAEQPYKVVGILKRTGTVLDNLIITSLESVWSLHSNQNDAVMNNNNLEVTALLLKYKNKTSAFSFPRLINKNTNMQAASPNLEISKLFKLTGEAHKVINYLSVLIVSLSFVGILFTLLNNISERKYDLAILRTLGFTKEKIFSILLIEGMTISFLGSLIGLMFGGIVYKSIEYFSLVGKNIITGQFEFISELIVVWFIILIISFLACLIPCIKAYKQNIRSTLLNN